MQLAETVLVFSLDRQQYALKLAAVERVVPSVEITSLPNAPAIVFGVFNLRGRIVPVMNVRRRFGLPERPIRLDDHFLVAEANGRTVALVVDAATGVVDLESDALIPAATILPNLPYVDGVLRLREGLVLIHDLATFLAMDEVAALDSALSASAEVNA